MRILVTGASGNIGTALLHELAPDPEVSVHGLSRRDPGPDVPAPHDGWTALDLGAVDDPGVSARLRAAVQGVDAVVHLAWALQPMHDRERLLRTNVAGSRAVFEAVRDAGVPHLVHVSSLAVYAPGEKVPVDESWPATGVPSSHYSRDKVTAEQALDTLDAPGTVISRVRPALVTQRAAAAEQARYFLGPLVPRSLVGSYPLPLLPLPSGVGFQVVHASDVARAIAALLRDPRPGAFNLAADPPFRPAELAQLLRARHVPVPAAVARALVAGTFRARLQPTDETWLDLVLELPLLDAGRARRELGWVPRSDGPSTLREALDGIRDGAGAPGPVLTPGKRRATP